MKIREEMSKIALEVLSTAIQKTMQKSKRHNVNKELINQKAFKEF